MGCKSTRFSVLWACSENVWLPFLLQGTSISNAVDTSKAQALLPYGVKKKVPLRGECSPSHSAWLHKWSRSCFKPHLPPCQDPGTGKTSTARFRRTWDNPQTADSCATNHDPELCIGEKVLTVSIQGSTVTPIHVATRHQRLSCVGAKPVCVQCGATCIPIVGKVPMAYVVGSVTQHSGAGSAEGVGMGQKGRQAELPNFL